MPGDPAEPLPNIFMVSSSNGWVSNNRRSTVGDAEGVEITKSGADISMSPEFP